VLSQAISSGVLAAAAVGVNDEQVAARSWIWAVVAGLVLSGALLLHAGWRAFSALPEPVRAATASTIRRHPRLLAVQLAIALWTVVFALYNLAYPNSFLARSVAQVTPVAQAPAAPPAVAASAPTPQVMPAPAVPKAALPFGLSAPVAGTSSSGAEPPTTQPPRPTAAPTPRPSPEPCQVQPVADVLRTLDGPAVTLTGRPLGSEAATVAEGAAGCAPPSASWAEVVLAQGALAVPAPSAATRCADVLAQLLDLRYIAPLAQLRVAYVDAALTDLTAACAAAERKSS
jgi:hypothetical protein